MYKNTIDDLNNQYIGQIDYNSRPVSDSSFILFQGNGLNIPNGDYKIYNYYDSSTKFIFSPFLDTVVRIYHYSISPDQRFVAADFLPQTGRYSGTYFLGILDLKTNIVKHVLRYQQLGNYYYPSWTNQGTLIVSYVCRADSITQIWEVDTNGVFLRKLFGKEELASLTPVESLPTNNEEFSISSIYPLPGQDMLTLVYNLNKRTKVCIALVDLSGRLLRSYSSGESREAGKYSENLSTANIPPGRMARIPGPW